MLQYITLCSRDLKNISALTITDQHWALKVLEVNRGAFRDPRAARSRYLDACPGLSINL